MEATRLRANLFRFALGMLKMQVQEPGVFGIGSEVLRRSQRRSAKLPDGVPDFRRKLIDMLAANPGTLSQPMNPQDCHAPDDPGPLTAACSTAAIEREGQRRASSRI
jgi:hypothetical protein